MSLKNFEHRTSHFSIVKDARRARLIEYLKKTYHINKLPKPHEVELVTIE